jgi:Spectrin repeat
MGWVSEKMQVALDESYRDPTNLQGKIQKHQAYEAELTANRKRIDVVSAVCIQLFSLQLYHLQY